MTKIYLIRHAEAEGNVYRRIHGQYDSRVTPNGLRQIEALEKRFAPVRIDACYASDLNRTCVTARAVYRAKGLELHRDARFREVNLGRWEDLPFGWLEQFEPEAMECFNHRMPEWQVEGGEPFAVHTARMLEGLKACAEENCGKTIAVFTHGCVLRDLQYLLTGEWPHYCENTAVSLLSYENGAFHFDFMNDSSHLTEEISTFARQKWWRESGDRRDFNMWYETEGETSRAILCGECVGQVRMSAEGCAKRELRIACMELDEAHCGRGLGEQLIGCAVSTARSSGCDTLVADVPENRRHFFEKHGFVRCADGKNDAAMKMDISVPQK